MLAGGRLHRPCAPESWEELPETPAQPRGFLLPSCQARPPPQGDLPSRPPPHSPSESSHAALQGAPQAPL